MSGNWLLCYNVREMSTTKPLDPAEKAARIERVLEQCEDLLFTYRFKRVSTDEIVQQLGMSKKTQATEPVTLSWR